MINGSAPTRSSLAVDATSYNPVLRIRILSRPPVSDHIDPIRHTTASLARLDRCDGLLRHNRLSGLDSASFRTAAFRRLPQHLPFRFSPTRPWRSVNCVCSLVQSNFPLALGSLLPS